MNKLIYIELLSFFLTGCCLQREVIYHSPPLDIQKRESCLTCENESLSSDETFPLKISDLLDIALTNNPQTKKVWAEVRASYYTVGVAKSSLYPTVNFQDQAAYTDLKFTHPAKVERTAAGDVSTPEVPIIISSAGTMGYSKILIHAIMVSWLVLDFGGRNAQINSAMEALYSTELRGNRALQEVMISVLHNYYHYMGYKALVTAKKSDIENDTASLELSEQQFSAGIQTKLDMLLSRSTLINNQSSLVELKGAEEIAYGNLMTALGLQATSRIDIEDFPEDLPLDKISENLECLIKTAQEERPDLAASFANYRRTLNDVVVAQSDGLPRLSAQGGWQRTLFNNMPILNQSYTASALVLQVPLFNGFLHVNKTRRAREYAKSAYQDYQINKLNVSLEVVKSYYDFTAAVDRVKFSEELLSYTQEAYDFAFSSYREGVASIMDLLVAQRDLAKARAQRIQARTQWAVALANISFATGSLSTD